MSNSLAAVHPELIAEWSDRNLPLTPDRNKYKGSFQWREMPHMLRCESDRGN